MFHDIKDFFRHFILIHYLTQDFPRVSVEPENPVRVERDETAELKCRVDAQPPVSEVKWMRNGRFISVNFK